ncbi:MAG: hypothetical protein Fur0022_05230 [Anaerolineales bacterium]
MMNPDELSEDAKAIMEVIAAESIAFWEFSTVHCWNLALGTAFVRSGKEAEFEGTNAVP